MGAVQGADPGLSVLTLDGAHGEGGGQLLRTAVALAVALRRPVALARVRVRRPKPGLQPQRLTVVRAGTHVIDVAATTPSAGSVTLLSAAAPTCPEAPSSST